VVSVPGPTTFPEEADMIYLEYLQKALLCLLLAVFSAVGVKLYIILAEVQKAVKSTTSQAQQAITEAQAGIVKWQEYSELLKAQADDPQGKRGVGLLLRSGDDLARTIKKANVTIDNLNIAITETRESTRKVLTSADVAISNADQRINSELLPAATMAIMQTVEAVNEVSDSIKPITDQIIENLTASRRAIEALEARVKDPQYDAIIRNISAATASASETLFHVERKTKELTRPISWIWRGVRGAAVVAGRVLIP